MSKSADVILCWTVKAPEGAEKPAEKDVLSDTKAMKDKLKCIKKGEVPEKMFVSFDEEVWGVAGSVKASGGLNIFKSLCKLEGLTDGKDFFDVGEQDGSHLTVVKQDLLTAFLCRSSAREGACSTVRPLLADGKSCPFSQSGKIDLSTDEAICNHYLELLLGRGARDKCPLAEKYLQGVARDTQLSQQPYYRAVLEGRFDIKAEDSVLSVLQKLDKKDSPVPKDLREDMALGVATKVLELVQVMGLDL
eukprot:TRINITY_DN13918_c1_g1_i1.p1 TRINITY_DN13918_c1_g1~~TRINITY_DN13918_c1_g1_i1.p1  ORF type:complete len:248 (-),score=68.05 TRINITY_DN13918_c1_g1_i1:297-1040(-)